MTTPRTRFSKLVKWAKENGVYVQRKTQYRAFTSASPIEYWREGQDHTIGEASTVREAYDDIAGSFIK